MQYGSRIGISALIGLFILLQCAGGNAHSNEARGEHARGREIYEYYCYQCHGYGGDARTTASQFLDPPPRDFTRADGRRLTRSRMIAAVRSGKPGTGMKSFARVLNARDSTAVVNYVRSAFMTHKRPTARYHTPANGWSNHERYDSAFPFANGTIAIDATNLSSSQEAGKRLFLSACITCHEARVSRAPEVALTQRVVSFPRNRDSCTPCHKIAPTGDGHRQVDGIIGAGPQDAAPSPNALQDQGRDLFKKNCAMCHAEDGSGRNWIGTFLEPHARDLTQPSLRDRLDTHRLRKVLQDGLPGTSMPAWKQVLTAREIELLVDYLTTRHQWSRSAGESVKANAEKVVSNIVWRKRSLP